MNTVRICKSCRQPLEENTPEGLCEQCLTQVALGDIPASPETRIPPEAGELASYFPQWEIIELLGMGGMGIVYKARHPQLDKLVALKILPVESATDLSLIERFSREARALAKLNHPGIVDVYDFGQTGPYYYFVMEFVDGMNLRQLIDNRTVTPLQTLEWMMQICAALQFAHDEGVIHRDIKPANILVTKKGQPKIADFGLVKLMGDTPGPKLTSSRYAMGTLNYMAPEQCKNAQAVDHRADIFSLGVVFYEMLTGEVPLGRFEPPSRKAPVDARLDEVVLRALEREPAKRYQSASELKSGVEAIAKVSAESPGLTERLDGLSRLLPNWPRWLPVSILSLAAFLALAVSMQRYGPVVRDRIFPPGADQWIARANELLERYDLPGNIDKAIGDLRKAVALDRNNDDAHASLAMAYWKHYDWSTLKQDRFAALSSASNALACNRECPTAWFVLGLVEQDQKQLSEAVNSLGHANTNFMWNNGEVLIQLAKVYWALKDTNNSLIFAGKAATARDKTWHFFNDLADYEFRMVHDYQAAESNFQEATRLARDSPKAWVNRGLALLSQGDHDDKAFDCFKKSLNCALTDEGFFGRGEYYLQMENYLAAARDFQEADRINTNRYFFLGNAGIALIHIPEKQGEAKEILSKALDKVNARLLETQDFLATANRGLYLALLGQTEDACKSFQQALASSPDTPQVGASIKTSADLLDLYQKTNDSAQLRQLIPAAYKEQ